MALRRSTAAAPRCCATVSPRFLTLRSRVCNDVRRVSRVDARSAPNLRRHVPTTSWEACYTSCDLHRTVNVCYISFPLSMGAHMVGFDRPTPAPADAGSRSRRQGAAVLIVVAALAAGGFADIGHVVAPGESLLTIARKYATTPQAIAQANHLANPNLII